MSDVSKDFRYYAEQSERQMQLPLGHEADGTQLYMDNDMKMRHVMRAQVYATLALAVTQADTGTERQENR